MRDLVNWWNSVVHLNGLLSPSNNNKTMSESMGTHSPITWDAVEGGASFCQIEVNKRGVEPVGFLYLSSKTVNFNNPFSFLLLTHNYHTDAF